MKSTESASLTPGIGSVHVSKGSQYNPGLQIVYLRCDGSQGAAEAKTKEPAKTASDSPNIFGIFLTNAKRRDSQQLAGTHFECCIADLASNKEIYGFVK